MNTPRSSIVTIESLYPGFGFSPLLELIDDKALITQAKWEERSDRISSCAPAAVLNAALLVGALDLNTAHDLHDRMLSMPSLWIETNHPDPHIIEKVQGFRYQSAYQRKAVSAEANTDDIIAILMESEQKSKPFFLRQLMHADRDNTLGRGRKPLSVLRFIEAVLGNTVLVSGYKQHATVISPDLQGGYIEINPRDPHKPSPVSISRVSRSWGLLNGPHYRRQLEAITSA